MPANTIRLPFGEYFGETLPGKVAVTSRRGSVPSARIVKIKWTLGLGGKKSVEYTIRRPLGEKEGDVSSSGLRVSRICSDPSAFILNTSESPDGAPAKTRLRPSADHEGWDSWKERSVSCCVPEPSGRIVKTLKVGGSGAGALSGYPE
jgi:hypothetical protein